MRHTFGHKDLNHDTLMYRGFLYWFMTQNIHFRIKGFFILCLGLLHFFTGNAQGELFRDSQVGIFFSSKQFEFSEEYYFPMTQFLKVEEDRSWTGNMKMELLIRMGELLTTQIGPIAQADSVYFVNADVRRGGEFLEAYQADKNRINPNALSHLGLDYIIVMDAFELFTRPVRSTFIRSNRMYTEKVQVKRAFLHFSIYDLTKQNPIWTQEVCYDERESPKIKAELDFYNEQSPLGRFLGKVFTQWWHQLADGVQSSCNP